MAYSPKTFSAAEDGSVENYVQREFQAVQEAFSVFDFAHLKKVTAAPKRVKDGLIMYADGTGWNPGSGEGIYGYYAGSWKKLG